MLHDDFNRLIKAPDQYGIEDVLRLTEGDLAPVSCLRKRAVPCDRAEGYRALPFGGSFTK